MLISLCSAEGDIYQRTLPRHPHGKCAYFVDIDLGMVADTAFGGASCQIMLHPIAGEHFGCAIIALYGEVDG